MLGLMLLLACGKEEVPPAAVADSEAAGDTGWPEDSGEVGTDADGDGWTLEEGDCDDDNIYVNPGREEDPSDGYDNDCDGRFDEDFSGLMAVQVWYDGSPQTLHQIDTLGGVVRTITLDDPDVAPYFLTPGVEGGYVVIDLAALSLVEVDEDGGTSLLASFEEEAEEGEISALYGLATHPDGYYLVGGGSALYAVEAGSGVKTRLVDWDPETGMLAFDLAVDPLSGDVGIFDYFGGFAVWDGALTERIPGGPYAGNEPIIYSGAWRDGVGWYAGAFTAAGFEVLQLDEAAGSWRSQFVFESQWEPTFFTIDGDSGDYYLSANAASYPTVWRVSASSGEQALFYESEDIGSTNVTALWDIYTLY